MDSIALSAKVRDKANSAQSYRRLGLIPAEYYGHGVENVSIVLEYQAFRKAFRQAGENTIIELTIEGEGKKDVLVHRVDKHPVSSDYIYIEFINVRMDEEVTTHVPIKMIGQAPAVKEQAGILLQHLDQIEVRCLPKDLIHEVEVSIESLVDFHTAIHVSDLVVPAKVTILTEADTVIANVQAPRVQEEETAVEMDVSKVEVTTEKKKDGEA